MRRGPYDHVMRERQGVYETFRDVFGCVLVVICAILVYLYDDSADYVDPTFTVVTVAVLAVTSYKYGQCLQLRITIISDLLRSWGVSTRYVFNMKFSYFE